MQPMPRITLYVSDETAKALSKVKRKCRDEHSSLSRLFAEMVVREAAQLSRGGKRK